MIKVTCLPTYYLFGDLHIAGIIPSTFLFGRHVIPSPSWKRAVDLIFFLRNRLYCSVSASGVSQYGRECLIQYMREPLGGVPIPKEREDI